MMKTGWICIYIAVLIWSAINPSDYFTWFLEVAPALIGAVLLMFTYTTFRFTTLAYTMILMHCIVLMIGGHYTYAEVPPFNWIRDAFEMQRNNYDKVGHFMQGLVPAIVAREILIRKNIISSTAWCKFLTVCFCLAFSAFYELIEWWVALASEESAEAFLGTQGYMWDTQSDMAFALLGSLCAIFFLAGIHDRQLRNQANSS